MSKIIKKHASLLKILLFVSLALRAINLNFPQEYYFDENYTAFTAVNLAQENKPEIWQPTKKPIDPPRAFEWLHPPTARLIIASTIKILGNKPWAWRLPSVIAGTLSILLIYLIGKSFFSQKIGLIAAYLLAFDGLSFTQSRIATTDSILVFFVLLSIFFLLRQRLFFSAIAAGLALSTKWIAIILLPLLLIQNHIFTKSQSKMQPKSLLRLGILTTLVYIFSYFPFFVTGLSPTDLIFLQKSMLTHAIAQNQIHPLQSPWFLWPIGYKPMPYLIMTNKQLWAIPNFIVFWLGLISIAGTALFLFKKHAKKIIKTQKNLLFALLCYLAFLLPWALIYPFSWNTRPTYFYYYLPSLPFLHLITAYWLTTLLSKKYKPHRTFAITILSVIPIIFLALYPRLVGL